MKPILFNTEMVRAILEGRKTVTRRVVKPQPKDVYDVLTGPLHESNNTVGFDCGWKDEDPRTGYVQTVKKPYRPGDILYVRETWQNGFGGTYLYKADAGHDLFMTPDGELVSDIPWRPSIHMPREAARIFLRVTDVRVERLQEIALEGCLNEGITWEDIEERDAFRTEASAQWLYEQIWNSTIKPIDRALYGWAANPWVWAIKFERCEKPKGVKL